MTTRSGASALMAFVLLTTGLTGPAAGNAEVISVSDTHFALRHEARSNLSPQQIWDRLVQPSTWWHPDHTYSGDAANLSLDLQAGGLWREDWDDKSVAHGRVLFVDPGKVLRLDAPFGPLQGLGAYTVWTITITPDEDGSVVVFDEVSTGSPVAKLTDVASAVDYVKGEAIRRLTADSIGE